MPKVTKSLPSSEQIVLQKKSLFERVEDYLESKELIFRSFKEKDYLEMQQRIDDVTVRVILDVFEEQDWERIMFYIVFPVFVPENRRLDVLLKINEINYKLISGCFAIDMSDGEIRFRCTTASDSELTEFLIEEMYRRGLNVSDIHFSELMEIAFKSDDPLPKKITETRPDTSTLQ